jgi:hypothetical protein
MLKSKAAVSDVRCTTLLVISMYKAVNQHSGEDIIILDVNWEEELDTLRLLGKQDVLVCQGCRQPVRVRAGEFRRWHFAHKHRHNCTYGHDSPTLLSMRAALYKWLVSKFGAAAVTLEKQIDGARFPRTIDCWVAGKQGPIAYWIVEAELKPQIRDDIQDGLKQAGARGNYLFATTMLREDASEPDQVYLTKTEREFMHQSPYDEHEEGARFIHGRSLHYLDIATMALTTFRRLHQVHAPHLFAGRKEQHDLSLVLVNPTSGEFVHPGEFERLQQLRQAQREREQREREQREREHQAILEQRERLAQAAHHEHVHRPGSLPGGSFAAVDWRHREVDEERSPGVLQGIEGVCMICGQTTTDWWYIDRATKQCKCRDCLRQGRA